MHVGERRLSGVGWVHVGASMGGHSGVGRSRTSMRGRDICLGKRSALFATTTSRKPPSRY